MTDGWGPERPTQDRGDLHLLSDEDVAERAAEIYAHAREVPGVDEKTAFELADMVYDLFAGEWAEILSEHDDHNSDYRITD